MGTLLKAALMLSTDWVARLGVLWHTTTAAGRFTPGEQREDGLRGEGECTMGSGSHSHSNT